MTEHRVNPLQWLSTKFASLNHSHNEYLTSHQDITGKEDKSNKSSSITTDTGSTSKYPTVKAVEDYAQPKGNYLTQHQSLKTVNNESLVGTGNISIDSGSDIDIVTVWEPILSDEKVASEKLVKESINSVLYETEKLNLNELTLATNLSSISLSLILGDDNVGDRTFNNINIYKPYDSSYEESLNHSPIHSINATMPQGEDSFIAFGDMFVMRFQDENTQIFNESDFYIGIADSHSHIINLLQNAYLGSSISDIQITLTQNVISNGFRISIEGTPIYVDNSGRDWYDLAFTNNVTINSFDMKTPNFPIFLSEYIDNIQESDVIIIPSDAISLDLNYPPYSEDKYYIYDYDSTPNLELHNYPLDENVSFTLIDKPSLGFQILITRNNVFARQTRRTWMSLENDDSLKSSIESLKQITSKYFKKEDFLDPECWYFNWGVYDTRPTYSNGTLTFTSRDIFYFKDGYDLPNDYSMSFTFSSTGSSPFLKINGTDITLGSNANEIYIYVNDGNTIVRNETLDNQQTITGKMESLEVSRGGQNTSSSITNFSYNGSPPSNNLWDRKQDVLVSGTNLKTINNESLLGSGNISMAVDSNWVNNSTNPVESQLIKTALDGKANSSHTHTKSQITDFPTIPSKTSQLTNDSGFLTSHQSLTGYLQQSDVKDNLTSTDTNKPLSAKQGKELKTLVDGKAGSSHTHNTTEIRDSSAYNRIGSGANDTQANINDSIDLALANIDDNILYTKMDLVGFDKFQVKDFINPNNWAIPGCTYSDGVLTFSGFNSFTTAFPTDSELSFDYIIDDGLVLGDTFYFYIFGREAQYVVTEDDINNGYAIIDVSFKSENNIGTIISEASGDEWHINDVGSLNPYTINAITPVGNSTKIANIRYKANDIISLNDNKEDVYNKVTSLSSSSTDTQYPSAKLVYDQLNNKAPTSHASSSTTYGVATASNYGHTKVINNLTTSSNNDGEALSAYQGKILNDKKLEKTTLNTIDYQHQTYGIYNTWDIYDVFVAQQYVSELNITDTSIDCGGIFQGILKFTNKTSKQMYLELTLTNSNGENRVYCSFSSNSGDDIDITTTKTSITLQPDTVIYLFIEEENVIIDYAVKSNSSEISVIADMIYPVGSIYMSVNNNNPQILFGGRWEQLKDRFLLGSGDTYTNGSTGGSATVTLTSAQSGVPAHSHKYNDYNTTYTLKTTNRKPGTSTAVAYGTSLTAGGGATERTSSNNTAANASQAHENMPPYLTVYMWKRTA